VEGSVVVRKTIVDVERAVIWIWRVVWGLSARGMARLCGWREVIRESGAVEMACGGSGSACEIVGMVSRMVRGVPSCFQWEAIMLGT